MIMALLTRSRTVFALGVVLIVAIGAYYLWPRPAEPFIVSTTTSLYEMRLLDKLKQWFEQANPEYNLAFISQGTGKAIGSAQRGDADLILVHDLAKELVFLQEEYGVNRNLIANNFFILVGLTVEPVEATGTPQVEALILVKASGEAGITTWASRGDESEIHAEEQRLWIAAGLNYSEIRQASWYLEAEIGMTATLQLTDQNDEYSLCDMGIYLSNFAHDNIQLIPIIDAGEELLNVYSVIASNPETITYTKFDASMAFITFFLSYDVQ